MNIRLREKLTRLSKARKRERRLRRVTAVAFSFFCILVLCSESGLGFPIRVTGWYGFALFITGGVHHLALWSGRWNAFLGLGVERNRRYINRNHDLRNKKEELRNYRFRKSPGKKNINIKNERRVNYYFLAARNTFLNNYIYVMVFLFGVMPLYHEGNISKAFEWLRSAW